MAPKDPTDEQLQRCQDLIAEIKGVASYTVTKSLLKPDSHPSSPRQNCCIAGSSHTICDACDELLGFVNEHISKAEETGDMRGHTIALDHILSDLRVSASLGCHMCSVIEAATLSYIHQGKLSTFEVEAEENSSSWMNIYMTPTDPADPRAPWQGRINLLHPRLRSSNTLSLRFTRTVGGVTKPLPNGMQNLSVPIGPSTNDDGTFQVVKTWLRTCEEQHERCKSIRPAGPNVPRRLLYLDETQVRVVENNGFSYCCLSHCWGSQENVPKQLIEEGSRRPFDIDALPQTFQDAVKVTKKLGFQYLWIDCFCIIQGDKQDWLRESAVMAQIYANSAVTVAALSAKSVLGGCFVQRNHLALQPVHSHNLTVEHFPKDEFWRLEVGGSRLESSPLHTRAWVVQERLAAARTVFFGSMGVYWECRCMRASETHTRPMDDVAENHKMLVTNLQAAAEAGAAAAAAKAKVDPTQAGETTWLPSVFLSRWTTLLARYTECNLSYTSDKLIALSGITKDIEKYSGHVYVQGLWRDSLAAGLLWHQSRPQFNADAVLSGRLPAGQFPSWSWASIQGRVLHPPLPGTVLWQTPVAAVGSDPEHLRLRLTTWKREVVLADDDDGENLALTDDGSKTGDLTEDYQWYSDDVGPTGGGGPRMWAVLVQRASVSETRFLRVARCLVVAAADRQGTYRRLGMVVFRFDAAKYDPFPVREPTPGVDDVVLV